MEFARDLLTLYGSGAGLVFSPNTLLLICLGTILGIVFGALPGLSSTMALALFTPLTFGFEPASALAFLVAIYISSVYAGALSAILVNIPGTPSAIATTLDGYPLARRGEAGRAIGLATLASFIGGFWGLIVLMLLSPMLAQIARQFGSWEYTTLALLALTLISYVSSGSIVRGLIGGVLGLLLASVGADVIMAYPRFAFGTAELSGGIHMVVLMIGFFGFAEVFTQLESNARGSVTQKIERLLSAVREIRGQMGNIFRASLIGIGIGILPGAGGSIASITAYGVSRRLSKTPEQFGRGSAEGLTAAESSNNASVGGALVPMMTMGIPGDPMTAVLIGAMMIHGLAPGPDLYAKTPQFVSAIFLGYLVALFFMLAIGLAAARPFARLIAFPQHLVLATIAVLCVLGAYAIQDSFFDVGIAVAAGFVGYLLKKVDVTPAPIILGVVLGPLLESNLRRAILLGDGSLLPFVTRPLSLLMLLTILVVIFGRPVSQMVRARRRSTSL
jgi:putative tricarboxylic transport membrane protein